MYELFNMSVMMSSYFSYILLKGVQKRSISDKCWVEQDTPTVANPVFLVAPAWTLVPERQIGCLSARDVADVSTLAKLAFVSAFS